MEKIRESFFQWLDLNLHTGFEIEDIEGFHFGIFETESGYTVYLSGSRDVDQEDWYSDSDLTVSQKYFAVDEDHRMDWQKVQDLVYSLLAEYMAGRLSILNVAKGISVGFDEGDVLLLKAP